MADVEFRNQIPRLSKADALGTLIEKLLSPDIDLSPCVFRPFSWQPPPVRFVPFVCVLVQRGLIVSHPERCRASPAVPSMVSINAAAAAIALSAPPGLRAA